MNAAAAIMAVLAIAISIYTLGYTVGCNVTRKAFMRQERKP